MAMHLVVFACVHNAGRSQMAAALWADHSSSALARSQEAWGLTIASSFCWMATADGTPPG